MTLPDDFQLPQVPGKSVELVTFSGERRTITRTAHYLGGDHPGNLYEVKADVSSLHAAYLLTADEVRRRFTPPHPLQHLVGKLVMVAAKERARAWWLIRVTGVIPSSDMYVKGRAAGSHLDDPWEREIDWWLDPEYYEISIIPEPIPSYEPF